MSEKLHSISNDQMHWRNCLLMSEKLHSISNDQMHWRFCLFCCLLSSWRTDKLLINDADETSKMKSEMLLTKMFDVRKIAFDFERSNALTILSVFQSVEAQRLSVDADETSDACWNCRLTDWLQNKLLIIRSKCWFLHLIEFLLTWLQKIW